MKAKFEVFSFKFSMGRSFKKFPPLKIPRTTGSTSRRPVSLKTENLELKTLRP